MGINMGYLLISFELEQMSKYLDLIQGTLNDSFEQLEKRYQNEIVQELSDDEAESLEDRYTDEFIEVGHDFPRLLLVSFIITWYSFIEQELLNLCDKLNLSISIRAKDNDNLDKGIRRARKFLLRGKDYTIDEGQWQKLVDISKLRNILVHEGKNIAYTYHKPDRQSVEYSLDNGLTTYLLIDDAMFQYLKKHEMIEYTLARFEIVPSFDYCKSLVNLAEEMFKTLYYNLKPNS